MKELEKINASKQEARQKVNNRGPGKNNKIRKSDD